MGRPSGATSCLRGSMPSDSKIVYATSAGATGRRGDVGTLLVGRADHLTRLHAAPAKSSDAAGPQWSRPVSLLIFGDRPNSPMQTTSVSSSKPRTCISSISAEKP